jgi:hypothetical protein
MPRLPDQWNIIDAATDDRPFRLVTSPARRFLNTSFTDTPGSRAREKRPAALIHPDDADRLGLRGRSRRDRQCARSRDRSRAPLLTASLPGTSSWKASGRATISRWVDQHAGGRHRFHLRGGAFRHGGVVRSAGC